MSSCVRRLGHRMFYYSQVLIVEMLDVPVQCYRVNERYNS